MCSLIYAGTYFKGIPAFLQGSRENSDYHIRSAHVPVLPVPYCRPRPATSSWTPPSHLLLVRPRRRFPGDCQSVILLSQYFRLQCLYHLSNLFIDLSLYVLSFPYPYILNSAPSRDPDVPPPFQQLVQMSDA